MRLLAITNLYPPQELGGYGRSIADFVWGLQELGHSVQVVSTDAPYLGPAAPTGPSGEPVDRGLKLKGSYDGGVRPIQDSVTRERIDAANRACLQAWLSQGTWDGVLLGNLDLLGPELLTPLLAAQIPIQHHVGFVSPPYHPSAYPRHGRYKLVAASQTVRQSLIQAGLPLEPDAVVYPGARTELFGEAATGMPRPLPADGSPARPLKVCFAGLLMASKGAHTVVEALIQLRQRGIHAQATMAGGEFQAGYRQQLEQLLEQAGLGGSVQFVGQLQRRALARMFALHHVGIFPSIHPEAFGIVAAEMQASGLVLVSSGVGGAAELVESNVSGLLFEPGNAASLAGRLEELARSPAKAQQLAGNGAEQSRIRFNMLASARQLAGGFQAAASPVLLL